MKQILQAVADGKKLPFVWDGLVQAMTILPLALAFGINSGIGMGIGVVAALFACLGGAFGISLPAPTCLLFLVFQSIALRQGLTTAMCAGAVGGLMLLILSFTNLPKKLPAAPPQMMQGFLCGGTVVYFFFWLMGYFRIPAVGTGTLEIFNSIRDLGFHANWRTVLFSTIMLVVLITYPRKFKVFSKILPAGFAGMLFLTGLNFWLNPDPSYTNVPEMGNYTFADFFTLPAFGELTGKSVIYIVLGGMSFALLTLATAKNPLAKKDCRTVGLCTVGSALLGGMPLGMEEDNRKSPLAAVTGAIFIVVLLLAMPFWRRMPVSAFASVLLLTIFGQISFQTIGKLFKDKKPLPVLLFFAVTAVTALVEPCFVIAPLLLASYIIGGCHKKKEMN